MLALSWVRCGWGDSIQAGKPSPYQNRNSAWPSLHT